MVESLIQDATNEAMSRIQVMVSEEAQDGAGTRPARHAGHRAHRRRREPILSGATVSKSGPTRSSSAGNTGYPESVNRLLTEFAKLPGIGRRSASVWPSSCSRRIATRR